MPPKDKELLSSYKLAHKMRKARRRFAISSGAQALFYELIALNNEEDAGWAELSFPCRAGDLCSALGCSEKTLAVYREELIVSDLVTYQSGKTRRCPSWYSLYCIDFGGKEESVLQGSSTADLEDQSKDGSNFYHPKEHQQEHQTEHPHGEKIPDIIINLNLKEKLKDLEREKQPIFLPDPEPVLKPPETETGFWVMVNQKKIFDLKEFVEKNFASLCNVLQMKLTPQVFQTRFEDFESRLVQKSYPDEPAFRDHFNNFMLKTAPNPSQEKNSAKKESQPVSRAETAINRAAQNLEKYRT